MPKLTWLADEFRAVGINVVEEPDWQTRGGSWRGAGGFPVGGVQHHTAPPVPYPVKKLYLPENIKCNWNVKLDGTVHVIAAGACNYSTGYGSRVALDDAVAGRAPTGTAASRSLMDDLGGNSYFLNNETDHPGDGSPIPRAQYRAVLLAWIAVCKKLDWPAAKVIAHGEWSRRKIDPAWDDKNSHQNMQMMRADIGAGLVGEVMIPMEMAMLKPIVAPVRMRLSNESIAAAFDNGIIRRANGKPFTPGTKGAESGIAFWSDPERTDEEWAQEFWPAFDSGVVARLSELGGG